MYRRAYGGTVRVRPVVAKDGGMHSEDRYNPQHILSLPPEIRASVIHQCGVPRALHDFAAYSDHYRICLLYTSRCV